MQTMLMTTSPMWFVLSLATNVNFSMQKKYLKILIKDSAGIFFSSFLGHSSFKTLNADFSKDYCKDSSYTGAIIEKLREPDV